MKTTPPPRDLLERYHVLRRYVGLTDNDITLARDAWPTIRDHVREFVDDFYVQIQQHDEPASVFTGGDVQVERLKSTLAKWVEELFCGQYDSAFVENRWLVGLRHVKIGLAQAWTAAAMCRLRDQILRCVADSWTGSAADYFLVSSSITRLMDLDLALIQDAYYAESVANHLRSEHAFSEAIIGTTESIVLLVDDAGRILRGNTYIARLVCGDDVLPKDIDSIDALIPCDQVVAIRSLLTGKGDGASLGPAITNLVDASGRSRHIRWFSRLVPRPGEEHLRGAQASLLVGHDVTEFLEAQRRAIQHERLAAIGQTMAGLAHESRNAFQRSQASLETLALEVSDRPEAVELIRRIERAHDHLLHLYEEVLQFAKPVVLELELHRIEDLIMATWAHITEAKGYSKDRLTVGMDSSISTIKCDAFAVEQVLRNLIENALAVSPESVNVHVRVEPDWQGNEKAVRIEVVDGGPGIAKQHLERIFEPFFSTRSRGSGLGLPIARRLTEAHGGSLELITSDSGTTAYLILPEVSHGERLRDLDSTDYRRE
ncbi:MAG: protoglobin domain-containing protein [Rubripirellula sp.]